MELRDHHVLRRLRAVEADESNVFQRVRDLSGPPTGRFSPSRSFSVVNLLALGFLFGRSPALLGPSSSSCLHRVLHGGRAHILPRPGARAHAAPRGSYRICVWSTFYAGCTCAARDFWPGRCVRMTCFSLSLASLVAAARDVFGSLDVSRVSLSETRPAEPNRLTQRCCRCFKKRSELNTEAAEHLWANH